MTWKKLLEPMEDFYYLSMDRNIQFQYEDDDHKPLSYKLKRPLPEVEESAHSSFKKLKLLDCPDDDDDDIPLSQRMMIKKTSSLVIGIGTNLNKLADQENIPLSQDYSNKSKKQVNKKSKKKPKNNMIVSSSAKPDSGVGQKWTTLVHNGIQFHPPYQPHGVKLLYDGKPVDLTPQQEEVATMYAVMLDSDHLKNERFNQNFFSDWRKILGKNHVIQELSKCDFSPIHEWHLKEKEMEKKRMKQMTKEEKKASKEEKTKLEEKYRWAIVDGVKEKVGSTKVEAPGLFRGRGNSPQVGRLKRRIYPSDVTLNIGKDAPIPECPVSGQSWKEVRHDNTVTWLAYYKDPIFTKRYKYVFLGASSTLKGQSDKEKYEKARNLENYIQCIRETYTKDFKSKDMTRRQIGVATYLIDKLALRAGNEKDDDEADTVGCCTLKVANVKLIPPNILEFDFYGKDSIRYYKKFEAEPLVYKAIGQFRRGKHESDDLFDKLDTSKLNAHLKELMPGLTAKVFRTYNASSTLDDMLAKASGSGDLPEKIGIYQHANKEVAVICNHQRTEAKNHPQQIERLDSKIREAEDELRELETDLGRAKKGMQPLKNNSNGKQKRNLSPEAIEKKIQLTQTKIEKLKRDKMYKEDLKEIALGTSKTNYLDPRITVAWCKRNEVPIEKIFNKSLLDKFSWAMDCDPSFRF